jgi:hypothetical protein
MSRFPWILLSSGELLGLAIGCSSTTTASGAAPGRGDGSGSSVGDAAGASSSGSSAGNIGTGSSGSTQVPASGSPGSAPAPSGGQSGPTSGGDEGGQDSDTPDASATADSAASAAVDGPSDSPYTSDGSEYGPGGVIADRSAWTGVSVPPPSATTAFGDQSRMVDGVTVGPLSELNAFDGTPKTRWSIAIHQGLPGATPQTFTVDMKREYEFSKIVLNGGSTDGHDWPRAWEVRVSNDGATWGSAITTGMGLESADDPNTTITFSSQIARYIQIKETYPVGVDTGYWWAIGEMNVYR